MVRLLTRTLLADRSRTLLGVLSVGGAVVLVILLEGFSAGLWQQVRSYRESWPVPLVAVPAGSTTSLQTRSGMPGSVAEQVRSVPGVRAVHPLIAAPSIYVRGDRRAPIYVVGYDQVGGPWRLAAGRQPGAPGEMVMDRALAKRMGFQLGDAVPLLGGEFRLVGLSAETASMLGSYTFVPLGDAARLLSSRGASEGFATLLLVDVQPGSRTATTRQAIEEAVPGVDVFTPSALAANDVAMAEGVLGSIMNLLVLVAYVVGVLVIGLVLYAGVLEHVREYGIMKALGTRNTKLYGHVMGQAAVFTAAGFAVGLLASLGVAALFAWLLPQYLVVVGDATVLLRVGVAALLMALVASAFPVRQVAGVDPAMVFRQ